MPPRPALAAVVAVVALALAAVVAVVVTDGGDDGPAAPPAPARDVATYHGLGAWVDVFDYAPAYAGPEPLVTPADVAVLDAHGVRTLYLQAARADDRSPEGIVDRELVGEFLARARDAGIAVVGWYLPTFADVDADLANLRLVHDFDHEGHRFDGVAVDIEYRDAVPDAVERNARLLDLSRRLRDLAGDDALGAIVPPPVLLEDVNPANWPLFPWAELGQHYDVWLPMSYWTFRTADSGWRDGFRYTDESVRRMRAHLGQPDAVVHPIGGIADEMSEEDHLAFARAAAETDAVGLSVYDFRTTSEGGWAVLERAARQLDATTG